MVFPQGAGGSGRPGGSGLPLLAQSANAIEAQRRVYERAPEAGEVRLVVGVLTAAGNVARRDAVRETWGADPRCAQP